jgi:hypothetical protein
LIAAATRNGPEKLCNATADHLFDPCNPRPEKLRLTEEIAHLEFAPMRVLRLLISMQTMIDAGIFLTLQRLNDLTWRSQCWL